MPAATQHELHDTWRGVAADLMRRDLSRAYITTKLTASGCPPALAKQMLDEIHHELNPVDRRGGFIKIISGLALIVAGISLFASVGAIGSQGVHGLASKTLLITLFSMFFYGCWRVFRGVVQILLG